MTDKEQRVLIGNRIAEARTMRGLSLQDIADSIGVARSTIQRYEKGLITNIKLPVISAIADALSVNPSWLVGKSEEMFPEQQESSEDRAYYYDPETSEIAEAVFRDPDLRMLFDAARDTNPDNIRLAAEMLRRFKNTNPDG